MPLKYIYTVLLLLVFASCEKEATSIFTPNASNAFNDTTWQENTLTNNFEFAELASSPLIDTIISNIPATFFINDSLSVYVPANAYTYANKQPITTATKIVIKAWPFLSKEAFISNAVATNSYLQLVDLLCYFKVQLQTITGETIQWDETKNAQIKLKSRSNNIQLYSNHKGFVGANIKYNNSNWITHFTPYTQAQFFTTIGIGSNIPDIGFQTNNIANIAFGKTIDTTNLKTRVNIILPPNYTNKNTQCFVVFKNSNTVMQLFSEPVLKYFYCLNIPLQTNAAIISISKINNDFYLASANIIANNANPYKLTPIKLSLAQLKEKLKALN
jgi:hypothetical protein